jgi:hypothetical protein
VLFADPGLRTAQTDGGPRHRGVRTQRCLHRDRREHGAAARHPVVARHGQIPAWPQRATTPGLGAEPIASNTLADPRRSHPDFAAPRAGSNLARPAGGLLSRPPRSAHSGPGAHRGVEGGSGHARWAPRSTAETQRATVTSRRETQRTGRYIGTDALAGAARDEAGSNATPVHLFFFSEPLSNEAGGCRTARGAETLAETLAPPARPRSSSLWVLVGRRAPAAEVEWRAGPAHTDPAERSGKAKATQAASRRALARHRMAQQGTLGAETTSSLCATTPMQTARDRVLGLEPEAPSPGVTAR